MRILQWQSRVKVGIRELEKKFSQVKYTTVRSSAEKPTFRGTRLDDLIFVLVRSFSVCAP